MTETPVLEAAPGTRCQLLDPIEDPRWGLFVDSAPRASIFHHPRWLTLLREQYGYSMMACCITDAEGRVRAGLPLALVSSPLTGSAARRASLLGPVPAAQPGRR